MNRDNHRNSRHSDTESDARTRNLRIVLTALMVLISVLAFIVSRDGITEVVPDLWSSAGTIVHLFGASDWSFG
ncbi:hypothetical protein SAMN05519104_6930 [Rhizobiales bacterium GAS188]|nr:hypothetical protein SAMN05519104_6930 [Rhizobiales bacterium GAS188]